MVWGDKDEVVVDNIVDVTVPVCASVNHCSSFDLKSAPDLRLRFLSSALPDLDGACHGLRTKRFHQDTP